jgi:hypothetical protein
MVYLKDAFTMGLRYRQSLMSEETAKRMATGLHYACEGILDAQSRLLGDVQVVDEHQIEQMRQWNARPCTETHDLVHQTFETQVRASNTLPNLNFC